jgi:hypothetical protein
MEPAALEQGREAIVPLEKWRNRSEQSSPASHVRGLPQATVVGFQMENGNCILEITAPREPLGLRFRSDLKNLNALRIFRSDAEALYQALAMEFGEQARTSQPQEDCLTALKVKAPQPEHSHQPEFIRMSKACIQSSPARKTKLGIAWAPSVPQPAEAKEVPSSAKIMADIYAMNAKLAAALASDTTQLPDTESREQPKLENTLLPVLNTEKREQPQAQAQPQEIPPAQQPPCPEAPKAMPPAAKSTFNFSPRKQEIEIPKNNASVPKSTFNFSPRKEEAEIPKNNTAVAPQPTKQGVDYSSLDESQVLMIKASKTSKMLMNHLIDQYFANNEPI